MDLFSSRVNICFRIGAQNSVAFLLLFIDPYVKAIGVMNHFNKNKNLITNVILECPEVEFKIYYIHFLMLLISVYIMMIFVLFTLYSIAMI